MKSKKLKPEIEFFIEHFPEDDRPEGHFEYPADVEYVHESLANGNTWAWCTIRVVARIAGTDIEGDDYLGACSYADEADFKLGGYFEDMKDRAKQDLLQKLRDVQAIDLKAV